MKVNEQTRKKSEEDKHISLVINGNQYSLEVGYGSYQVKPSDTLAYTLRETLGLTGTKVSCDDGACGSCTVLMSSKAVPSCMILTVECEGKDITTIEGLGDPKTGTLDPLQQSFVDHTAFQCGFCTPGMIMSTKALLDRNPKATRDEIRHALRGNLCRCTGYVKIMEAVEAAEDSMRQGGRR